VDLSVHPNGTTTVPLQGALATGSGTTNPRYAGGTCSSTYCHGATLGAGGSNHAPSWSGGPGEAACGTCHAVPPPTPHVQNNDCGRCHPGNSNVAVNPATHVNGRTDLVAMTCTTCHGDPARTATPQNPQLPAAPPTDTLGQQNSARVGAHLTHLTGSALAPAVACTECHVVPSDPVDLSVHPAGTTTVPLQGALATGSGTTSPQYAGGTCSATYCHGATLGAGGSNHAPSWSGGPGEAACGTCHGVPPPTPHVQNNDCGRCHPGYSNVAVNPATHVNGRTDLVAMTCTTCHGGADNSSGAPPSDTSGRSDTTLVSVGAHTTHVEAGLDCGVCHVKPAVISSPGHIDGKVTITWGPLATANGALAPTFDEGSATCTNVYCHGAFPGGNRTAPNWTRVGAGEAACGTCHGVPPPPSTNHPQRISCGDCHVGYTSSTVNPATHLNGTIEIGSLTCSSCHGDPARAATTANPQLAAAPPVDTQGNTATAAPGVGAHQIHLNGSALASAVACTECHVVPSSPVDLSVHPTGTTTVPLQGALATGAITNPNAAFSGLSTTTPQYAAGTCSSTYCHGAYSGSFTYTTWDWGLDAPVYVTISYAGQRASPTWGGTATCGSCHGAPPADGHVWHSGSHGGGNDCKLCHPDAAFDASGTPYITDPSRHVDGKVDLAPSWVSSCFGCH
jgi:predicted CxxxxCH...CXXCH cytochrome family protein